MLRKPFSRSHQVRNVCREIGVNKVSLTIAQSRKVKAEHAVPLEVELTTDIADYPQCAGASKAVGKNGKGVR